MPRKHRATRQEMVRRRKPLFVCLASLLFLLSAGQADAGTAEAQDPKGDPGDPRADITTVGANYQDGYVILGLEVPSLEPPDKWKGPEGLSWDVKTDRGVRYVVWHTDPSTGSVYEYRPDGLGTRLCDADPRFANGVFLVRFPARCIGSPASITIRGYASYEDKAQGVDAADFAPDDGFCCEVNEGSAGSN